MRISDEIALRRRRFARLADEAGVIAGVAPAALKERVDGLRVFYGGRGVWYDAARTRLLAELGVTVGRLHTGRHYSDDLLSDGIVNHYPRTGTPGKDAVEV